MALAESFGMLISKIDPKVIIRKPKSNGSELFNLWFLEQDKLESGHKQN